MTGFTWRSASGTEAERRRGSSGRRGFVYTPIVEKKGFWPNHGAQMTWSLLAFLAAIFVLTFGWTRGLALGGPMYYAIAIAGVLMTGAFPAHLVRRYMTFQRIVNER